MFLALSENILLIVCTVSVYARTYTIAIQGAEMLLMLSNG